MDDELDLIQTLCTQAGMIMEDASAEALLIQSAEAERLDAKLALLADAAQAISTIVAAALALHRRASAKRPMPVVQRPA